MAYEDIQKLIQQEVSTQLAAQQQQTNDKNLFDIPTTPFHTHNQQDSPSFPLDHLADAVNYTANAQTTLTALQTKALKDTAITLVPAQGASSVIIVMGVTAYLKYLGTAYTGANNLEFRYTGAAGAKVTVDMAAAFINSAVNAWDYAPAVATELTPVANAPIVVAVPTANPGTGNSLITFVVSYRVVSTATVG